MLKRFILITFTLLLSSNIIFSQQHITGGHQINISDAPWQVLLEINGNFACGGSIVAPNIILTAKHCVESNIQGVPINAHNVRVITGITCTNEINMNNIHNVSQIVLHPTLDVALLFLNLPLNLNNNVKVINYRYALEPTLYNVGNNVSVSGWGWLTPNGFQMSQCLNAVEVHIISNQDATSQLGITISNDEVATSGIGTVRQGACHGDSGGPLVIWSNALNQHILIGVVSWGRPSCVGNNTNSPSIFVRVSSIVDWINSFITGPDLLIRDDDQDDGTEPNPRPIYWQSPDIKLVDYSFNPIPNSQLPNYTSCYIAVTVKNVGNVASTGKDKLHLHWSKSSLNSKWYLSWKRANTILNKKIIAMLGLPEGEEITNTNGLNIPILQPNGQQGNEVTLYVLWNLPDYIHQYNEGINQFFARLVKMNWGFALLARVDDGNYTYGLSQNLLNTTTFARENNNVAIDNGSLLLFKKDYSNLIYLDVFDKLAATVTYKQLLKEDKYKLNDFAEVYAILSNDLINKLDYEKSSGIKKYDENRVFLTSDNSELVFKDLDSEQEVYFIGTEVNFISDKMPELNDFNFDLIFKEDGKDVEIMRYTAIRDADVYFKAQVEASKKKVVRAKEEVTLTSNIIFEDATYTWYDEGENVIGKEYQITIIPEFSQKYKIEIKQEKDGFKAYDEVEVIVVDGMISSLSPNPANDYVRVEYKLSDNATNVSLQISDYQNLVSVSYPISTTNNFEDISLSSFIPGIYMVKLIIDGVVVDMQTVIKK